MFPTKSTRISKECKMDTLQAVMWVLWFCFIIIIGEVIKWYAAFRITNYIQYLIGLFK